MDKVDTFRALHVPGDPLVLFNIWDAGSAKAVANAGARAIATGSYAVAETNGFKDGETLPLEVALENLRRIVSVTELPVTIDMEAGYGDTPDEVKRSIGQAREAGAVGINLEDRMPGKTSLIELDEAAGRVAAAASIGIHVNARTDVYLGRKAEDYTPHLIDAVIERAEAYARAGAGSLFVPFLGDHPTIAQICERSPLPVNVLWAPGRGTMAELAALGVARISFGHGPWAAAMAWLASEAKAVFGGGVPAYAG
ncbi:isocitrate lyase/PEP mutase family protein [Tsuneonella sp. HG249]